MRLDRGVAACYLGLFALSTSAAWLPIPVWAQMLPMTLMIIYIGAKNTTLKGEDMVVAEQMQTKDAMMFPVIGSLVLFSLYLVFKFLPADWVNIAVKLYFFAFGLLVVGAKISQILTLTLPQATVNRLTAHKYKLRIPCCKADKKDLEDEKKEKEKEEEEKKKAQGETNATTSETENTPVKKTGATVPAVAVDDKLVVDLTQLDIIAHIFSAMLGAWYLATNHWAASNLFGIGFSIQGIEVISLGSFLNGFILLCGLFFYDIFWVFGTDVMVTVAKSFDAPIKLLFPQHGVDSEGNPLRPSLLGLGDIVIPGIYIALLLRFDLWLAECVEWRRQQALLAATTASSSSSTTGTTESTTTSSTTPPTVVHTPVTNPPLHYFHTVLVFYFLGLLTTLLVMYKFQAAQPALLYLVPACLISAFGTALVKGQVKDLWNYKETAEEPPKEKEKEKEKEKSV